MDLDIWTLENLKWYKVKHLKGFTIHSEDVHMLTLIWCLFYEQYEMKYLITPQFNVLYCHSNRGGSHPCFTHRKSREKVGQVMSSSLCAPQYSSLGATVAGECRPWLTVARRTSQSVSRSSAPLSYLTLLLLLATQCQLEPGTSPSLISKFKLCPAKWPLSVSEVLTEVSVVVGR